MVRTPEISALWERAPARESALWERAPARESALWERAPAREPALWERAPAREWITRTNVFARRGALPHRYAQHP